MGGDPFGMLLRQRIVFLGGEVRRSPGFSPIYCIASLEVNQC